MDKPRNVFSLPCKQNSHDYIILHMHQSISFIFPPQHITGETWTVLGAELNPPVFQHRSLTFSLGNMLYVYRGKVSGEGLPMNPTLSVFNADEV